MPHPDEAIHRVPSDNTEDLNASRAQQVLFVCEHGAAKSVFAGSYFNAVAQREGLNARAVARGVDPDENIVERIRAEADAAGFPLCAARPVQLTRDDVTLADVVVAFDLQSPELETQGPHESWDGLPSLKQEFERGRAAIMSRVDALVAEMKARAAPEQPG